MEETASSWSTPKKWRTLYKLASRERCPQRRLAEDERMAVSRLEANPSFSHVAAKREPLGERCRSVFRLFIPSSNFGSSFFFQSCRLFHTRALLLDAMRTNAMRAMQNIARASSRRCA